MMNQENKPVTLTLFLNEAVFTANVMGELPTKSNSHPLFVKIVEQIKEQYPESVTQPEPKEINNTPINSEVVIAEEEVTSDIPS